MIVEKCYNIHSIIKIIIRANPSVIREVDYHLGPFSWQSLDTAPDVIIDSYDAAPVAARTTVVDEYEYGSGIYHRKSLRLWIDLNNKQQLYYMDRLALPINLIIQLALLRVGYSFLHGAALLLNGKTVVFPAYPGTGKTTIVAAFVKLGGKLFGDDLCIMGDGRLYSYPQAFSVYPHHLPVLPYKDEYAVRAFRKTELIDKLCSIIEHNSNRWVKFIRLAIAQFRTPSINMMPEIIFGDNAIAQKGVLEKVVVIERSGDITELVHEPVNVADIASQATAILWHEWHASFHDLLLYDALSASGRYTISLFKKVNDIYLASFQSVPCSRVRIPASWSNEKLVQEFPSFFNAFVREG